MIPWNDTKMINLSADEVEDLKHKMTDKINSLVEEFTDEREDHEEAKANLPWYHRWLEFIFPSTDKEYDMYEDERYLLAKKLMYMVSHSFKYKRPDAFRSVGYYEVSEKDYNFILDKGQ